MDRIINFLEKKLMIINTELIYNKTIIKEYIDRKKMSEEDVNKVMKMNDTTKGLLSRSNDILEVLREIQEQIKDVTVDKEKKHERFLQNHAYKFVDNNRTFDKYHPLFGYEPFHNKLLAAYENFENYEKCYEIVKVIDENDSDT